MTDPGTLATDPRRFADYVYTPIEQALELNRERRCGRGSARLERAIGAVMPPVLDIDGPIAVVFRQVATPNYELRRLLRLSSQLGLTLVVWEFHSDRFLTRNRMKYALGRLGFYSGLGRHGGRRIEYVNVFDLDGENGKPLRDIRTFRDEPLIAFHHRLLHQELPGLEPHLRFDASDWFVRHGATARSYYEPFLALFLQRAILFETVLLSGDEQVFAREVFLPAFARLERQFGLKPLIAQAEPTEWEGDDFWQLYPQQVREQVGVYRAKERIAVDAGAHWLTPSERDERPDWPLPMRVPTPVERASSGTEPNATAPADAAESATLSKSA